MPELLVLFMGCYVLALVGLVTMFDQALADEFVKRERGETDRVWLVSTAYLTVVMAMVGVGWVLMNGLG